MTQTHTGERMPANRQKAKPPPATTTHRNYAYMHTRIADSDNNW